MKTFYPEALLDWVVSMDFKHYKTYPTPYYKPSGQSHFYLNGSQERFTSSELVKIFKNKMTKKLHQRWLWALEDVKKKYPYITVEQATSD